MTTYSPSRLGHEGQPDTIVEEPPRRRSTLLTGLPGWAPALRLLAAARPDAASAPVVSFLPVAVTQTGRVPDSGPRVGNQLCWPAGWDTSAFEFGSTLSPHHCCSAAAVCPFILGNEFCERLAFYGLSTNLVIYLTRVMGEDNGMAAMQVGGLCREWAVQGVVLFFEGKMQEQRARAAGGTAERNSILSGATSPNPLRYCLCARRGALLAAAAAPPAPAAGQPV